MKVSTANRRPAVIIPAYNEEANIGTLLDGLTAANWEQDYQIIVSCNACTDRTLAIAQQYAGVLCLSSREPSKINALNLADQEASGYPRIYVDADVLISHASILTLIERLAIESAPALVAPLAVTRTVDSSFSVRHYYKAWSNSKYCLVDGYGSGVYGLNQSARLLFHTFPAVISDDGFVRRIIDNRHIIRVVEAKSYVRAPSSFSELIKVKTRSKLGNIQLSERNNAVENKNTIGPVFQKKIALVSRLIYMAVNFTAFILARKNYKKIASYKWQRDESSRGNAKIKGEEKKKKILAISSKGGHWLQLLRLQSVWADQDVFFVCNDPQLHHQVAGHEFSTVIDASMDSRSRLIIQGIQVFWIVMRIRPDLVITTGAAPGFFAILWGNLIGAKTVWVDSIANAEELSLAGKKVGKWADIWLTQWPELARPEGPYFEGRVF
ncbi:glycosyltransferase [Pseudomonas sp. CCC2.2]|uniref:glycosyltransferase n=1 Tax=Pseudomonas sp. CCC2.2 TaxID=3048605 RepID=UPI002B23EB34|nr:glycosyltransferase [Pseudomonas sp. CCC2.2]MEB0150096.1 glycosyltransferase [Pseudomonas sp. CCC2.2]